MRNLMAALALIWAGWTSPLVAEAVLEFPEWMAGAWHGDASDIHSEEFWSDADGDIMLGAARSVRHPDGYLLIFEHTRIVRKPDGSLSYFAQPRGVPPSEFPMVGSGADWIEFANPAHDYPQRVRYWREGRLLKARISLMDGSNAAEWTYKPMGAPE